MDSERIYERAREMLKVFAIVSGTSVEDAAFAIGDGILARSDIRCVCIAPEAELAGRLAAMEAPDLLILDMDIPGFNALHVVRGLRNFVSYMSLPIFVVSGRDCGTEAKAAGATHFFTKPVVTAEMEYAFGKYVKSAVRKAARKRLRGLCAVSKSGVKVQGRMRDISLGGAQVATSDRLPVGAMVKLGFAVILQNDPHIIRCNARVVREVAGGYGLAFCQLDGPSRSLLQAIEKS